MRVHLGAAVTGLLLGGVLTKLGFWDFGEVHRMFLLHDLRLLLAFAGAVALVAVGLAITLGRDRAPQRPVRPALLGGAALFGAGWAVTGACPGAALVQFANGYLPALASLAGIGIGMLAERRFRSRLYASNGSCDE